MTTEELALEVERLRGVLARIESLVWYEPQDDDDTVESVRAMVRERDEALAEAQAWQAEELARRTERNEARAEVARREREHEALLETAQKALAHAERERDEARAEVERLREAAASSMALCSWECSDETYCGRCKPLVRALNEADE